MSLVSVDDVQRVIGLSDSQLVEVGITEDQIQETIYDAESDVERECQSTFLVNDSSLLSVVSATNSTAVFDVDTFTDDQYNNYLVYISSGLGSGQWKIITDTTTTTLTVDSDWETNPDNTSKVYVVYAPWTISQDSRVKPLQDITVDGNGTATYFLPKFPLLRLDSLTISSTSVTTSNVYQYNDMGKLRLKTDAEVVTFENTNPQLVNVQYWFGVYMIPRIIKRAIATLAGMRTLVQQIGGTYDDVATFSLPHISGSLGQPYINIREVVEQLRKDYNQNIKPKMPHYWHML